MRNENGINPLVCCVLSWARGDRHSPRHSRKAADDVTLLCILGKKTGKLSL